MLRTPFGSYVIFQVSSDTNNYPFFMRGKKENGYGEEEVEQVCSLLKPLNLVSKYMLWRIRLRFT